jgi:hypothetical protein
VVQGKGKGVAMRRILTLIVVISILLAPLPLLAEEKKEDKEISIAVGLFTKHYDSDRANEHNRLLALSYDNWTVTWFKNSYYQETIFAGYAFRTDKYAIKKSDKWFVRGGAYLGVVYGYGDNLPTNVGGFSPFLLPVAEIGYSRFSFELGVIPLPNEAGLITGMFKVTF